VQFTRTVCGIEGSFGEPALHSVRDYPKDADVVSAAQPYNRVGGSASDGCGNLWMIAIGE